VLGTIATNHSKALRSSGQTVASSLIGGYHLAFAIGAVCIAVGIVTARAVLRTPKASAATQLATDPEPAHYIGDESEPQLQRQAA